MSFILDRTVLLLVVAILVALLARRLRLSYALSLILAALPLDFPAPLLVVQHLSPDFPSQLARILGHHTPLHVKQADRLQAGWVYVAPPGRHLLACADGSLTLTFAPMAHHCRPSADVLLTSVAAAYSTRAIGVILTGGDGDGAAGIQAIKAARGVTVAQDLSSSRVCREARQRLGPWTMCYPCPTSPPLWWL